MPRPAGATYAWEEGDVLHNEGPLYVGADPYMAGTPMFLDTLSIHARALPEREIVAEAGGALGPAGPFFIALGCAKCTAESLMQHCSELDEHHPCLCQELMGGGLQVARVQGWLRGPSERWNFHADAPCRRLPRHHRRRGVRRARRLLLPRHVHLSGRLHVDLF